MYSPLTGTVVASNEAVEGKPGLVNSSPEEDGWLFRVLLEDEQEVVLPTAIKSIQKRVLAILVKIAISGGRAYGCRAIPKIPLLTDGGPILNPNFIIPLL